MAGSRLLGRLGMALAAVAATALVAGTPALGATAPASASAMVLTARTLTAATPTISGTVAVGGTLTAKAGKWTAGTKLGYRWYANGSAIAGATKSTLRLSSAQRDKRITVRVTGKKAGYATRAATSRATSKVTVAGTPTISGSARVTAKLTAKPGTWTKGTAFSYQWYANGKAIAKAIRATYTVSAGVAGKKVTVKVTGKKAGYATVGKTSKTTASVVYPTRTAPISLHSCPAWAPIKGNADSMIYHVPTARFYGVTNPEDCFRTEAAARAAGYRKAKV